ncbi:MAG: pseudaminic acid synthase [Clostridiales bacterium]|jgi:pseudaminic acid synthase|nr:pseudaminic acid synthase [Eubacteriales bacterium]MDH7566158.1 pseudaminic acid synthase [Clostridiales bacterium]
MKQIKIKNRSIGQGHPCYIIAEMSANHAGDIHRAVEIIHAAREAGADCIKIQTYTADTLTIDSNKEFFTIKGGQWNGENLYGLYKKAFTPWEWQGRLKEEAEKAGIDFLSTPFDKTAVDFLEELGVDFYKIASFEVVDIPLVKYIAAKGKPVIMSVGMASLGEIEDAVHAVRSQGNENLCLLKCSSTYPAPLEDMNLKTIRHLEETFDVAAGLSDHSMGSIAAVAAVAVGAKVIEKHFCISRKIENPDASFSMEPEEFKQMVDDIRSVEKALGKISYDLSEGEKASRSLRKSIFVVEDIKKGEKFTEKNIRVIRPGYGLMPKYYEGILGRHAARDIDRATPLNWSMVE